METDYCSVKFRCRTPFVKAQMHASSLENMQRCYEEYFAFSELLGKQEIRVLDVGGADVNGSYRNIFTDKKFKYVGLDLQEGPGVDVVIDDPYQLPFEDGAFDILVSGQAFEHVEFFWKLFEEMSRVIGKDGFIFLIAPSGGPIHRYPVDCYRFYPDAYQALAKYTGINLAACWMDDRGPWNDLVGVFTPKPWTPRVDPICKLPINRFLELTRPAPVFEQDLNPKHETVRGEIPYLKTIERIHQAIEPQLYFEIGTRKGNSLALASCESIAVDPFPELSFELGAHQTLIQKTSDRFFREDAELLLGTRKPDLSFIDGMHLFEFALRDFIQIERRSSPSSVVIIDDIFPNHVVQSSRQRKSRVWTGDVWKLYEILKQVRPDLILVPIDCHPTGLLVVVGLNPNHRILSERYNPLVKAYRERELGELEERYVEREGAISPAGDKFAHLLEGLVEATANPNSAWKPKLKERVGL